MFGADDGLGGMKRLDLKPLGIDLNDDRVFSVFCVALAALGYFLLLRLVRSPFGQALKAIKQNENRTRAQGCPVHRFMPIPPSFGRRPDASWRRTCIKSWSTTNHSPRLSART
jgi:hypothetical protein